MAFSVSVFSSSLLDSSHKANFLYFPCLVTVDFVFNGRCFEWSIAIRQGKESHWITKSIVRTSKAGFVSIHRLFRDPSNKTSNCVLLKIQIHFSQNISNERSLGSRAGCRPVFTISGELNGNGGKRCLSAAAVFDCKWFVRLAQRTAHTLPQ